MRRALGIIAATGLLGLSSASADESVLVFGGVGNWLDVYDVTDPDAVRVRTLIPSHGGATHDGPATQGDDINAQICFQPRADGRVRFIAGEDSNQGAVHPDTGEADLQGWGYFELLSTCDDCDEFAGLSWKQLGKLVPSYEGAVSNAENYGCGFLSDGRLVLSDVGNQLPTDTASGQLHLWFPQGQGTPNPSFEMAPNGTDPVHGRPDFVNVPWSYCKIDTGIPTVGGVYVADDSVFLASNRPRSFSDTDQDTSIGGIFRYSNLPTSLDECDLGADGVYRAKLSVVPGECADCVLKTLFIPADALSLTPSAIAKSARDTYFVSSVFNGSIAEYDLDGRLIRPIIVPDPTVSFGMADRGAPTPRHPTPYGIGVDPRDGTIYYADLGVRAESGPGPGNRTGTVGRVRFDAAGNPLPFESMATGLPFPDGIGVLQVDLTKLPQE